MKPYNKKIVLENGKEFYGYGFGADKEAVSYTHLTLPTICSV